MSVDFTHDGPGRSAAEWQAHRSWSQVPALLLDEPGHACERLVVVAAHPDDESLGVGGLIAHAHDLDRRVYVVLLTAGERSHPGSTTVPPHDLAVRRLNEAQQALDVLAPGSPVVFLGLPDGEVAAAEDGVVGSLVDLLGDGRNAVLVAPWRQDGHPDHEAAGRAAAAAARRTGARLVEYPIWAWRHLEVDDLPWPRLRRLDLGHGLTARKRAAILEHVSQIAPLSDRPGDDVLLGPEVLEHFLATSEHFLTGADPTDDALDRLHREQEDPWGVDHRWYEQRKRDLTLAALPRAQFRRALEIGCSRGALADDLADRCASLVAVDRSEQAVVAARERLATHEHAEVRALDVPREWPEGRFDLVVLSETGYFLSPSDLDRLVDRIVASLTSDGVVLLCHWRHPVDGWVLDGPDVHSRFEDPRLPPAQARYQDRDVEIVVCCRSAHWPEPGA